MNVLSYHLCIEAAQNRILSGTPSVDDIKALESSDAVILPQPCRESLYRAACRSCSQVFPNYDAFFEYQGKTGQDRLFKKMGVPYPQTFSFFDVNQFSAKASPLGFPFVFKLSWGGEGKNVFLVTSEKELAHCLVKARESEKQGEKGFLVQEYIPTGGRSLRVVVIHDRFFSYWRQDENGGFYTNLAKGAVLDHQSSPDLQEKAVHALRDFCRKTKINLAGFDFLFDEKSQDPLPLFLEINYCFRCKGLGGVGEYHKLLAQGIKEWLGQVR
ncbi:MAG: glutathione synthase [Desulfobulbaceae bacterium]|nr:glutathione synthase [Desulfobulbaceae bacterium]